MLFLFGSPPSKINPTSLCCVGCAFGFDVWMFVIIGGCILFTHLPVLVTLCTHCSSNTLQTNAVFLPDWCFILNFASRKIRFVLYSSLKLVKYCNLAHGLMWSGEIFLWLLINIEMFVNRKMFFPFNAFESVEKWRLFRRRFVCLGFNHFFI